ncbi:MAG: sedoheptulokinase [Planctomycetota bacterium]|jgi:sedoheptulokinase
MKNKAVILGIDIGTSKVAAVIIDTQKQLLAVCSKRHKANMESPTGRSEQDVEAIIATVRSAVLGLRKELRMAVRAIGVTGQMHGVVVVGKGLRAITPLITWQDKRCLEGDFLGKLNPVGGYCLRSGFGCASLAWLCTKGLLPSEAVSASTIHDLLVARVCELDRPVTDPTDAASWGLFDLHSLNWDFDAIRKANVPMELLPKVVPCSSKAGMVCKAMSEELCIPAGIPVATAIGDNQASLLATLREPENELALTLGTGGQLSAVLATGHEPEPIEQNSKYEYRPFPGSRFVVTAAALCGGSAWEWLAAAVEKWLGGLKVATPSRDDLYKRLSELGLKATHMLEVRPNFLGERYDDLLRGSINRIDLENFDLGTVSRSLARGIIENLKDMLPAYVFKGRDRIVGSGNALRRTKLLQVMIEEVFGLRLDISQMQEEAACGAALNSAALITSDPGIQQSNMKL